MRYAAKPGCYLRALSPRVNIAQLRLTAQSSAATIINAEPATAIPCDLRPIFVAQTVGSPSLLPIAMSWALPLRFSLAKAGEAALQHVQHILQFREPAGAKAFCDHVIDR